MNQWLADLFLALPSVLTAPHVFGTICLALCWTYYVFDIRGPITRAVRECSLAFRRQHLSRRRDRLFYGAARKKARLDEGGVYLVNLASFLLLCMTTVLHGALFFLCVQGDAMACLALRMVLTLTIFVVSVLALLTQPSTTLDRRTRWGFARTGSVVRAVLRELFIVAVLFLWIYDAWFLPAIAP